MKIIFLTKRHFLKTKSDQFLIALLEEFATVVVLRRENYSSRDLKKAIAREKPDCLVFFATPPSLYHHVLRFPFVKKIYVPMYDGFKPFKPLKALLFRLFGLKALCFSQPTEDYLKSLGLRTLGVRYFPQPAKRRTPKSGPPYKVFFWQRNEEITLPWMQRLLDEEIIHRPEKGSEWLSKEAILALMAEADYYIAPRKQEGIGMSFLDALALGLPVIAYNDHTMKDYIKEGENGYLFDEKTERLFLDPPKDLADINNLFYKRWQDDRQRIRSFFF